MDEVRSEEAMREYEEGFPSRIDDQVQLLRSELLRVKANVGSLSLLLFDGDTPSPQPPPKQGDGEGKQTPKKDPSEAPDTGPAMDAKNYKAKVRSIRTDANGKYDYTQLQMEQPVDDEGLVLAKGDFIKLRNPAWEKEFKRAQGKGLTICLRITGGRVQAIEVLS